MKPLKLINIHSLWKFGNIEQNDNDSQEILPTFTKLWAEKEHQVHKLTMTKE